MRASTGIVRSILAAACLPVVASAQTIVFQENFDGGTGVGKFDSFQSRATGDGTFNANFDYGAFQYKRWPDFLHDEATFTSQPIPAAPGGSSTTGLRVNVDEVTGLTNNIQLIPHAVGGGSINIVENFKIEYDFWHNYNGGEEGGAGSTQHTAVGVNFAGTGVTGGSAALGGTAQPGYLVTATGEGGNTGDYRLNTNDPGDDGPTYDKKNANWTGIREIDFDHVTGAYIGGNVNPDEAQNSYLGSIFPAGVQETPGAPGKAWVHVTIEQHGNAVEYSMNGKHIATLFLSAGTFAGVPSFGMYDRNGGIAAPPSDLFTIFDNIKVTQNAAATKFNATSGTFANAANWTNGVPSGTSADAVFDGASGAANVTMGAPVTLRALRFDSANSYTVGGTSTISLSAETNNLISNAGNHTVGAPVTVTGHMSAFTRDNSSITLTNLKSDPNSFFGKSGNGTLAVNQVRAKGLTVTAGVLKLAPGGGNSKVGGLVVDSGGTLKPAMDITNSAIIVDYTLRAKPDDPTQNNSPLAGLLDPFRFGYNNGDYNPPAGTKSVIISSTAAAVFADGSNPHKTGVGFAEASAVLGPTGGTFRGEAVDGDAVLIRYTFLGDTNLDGKVNALDFNAMATNYGSPDILSWVQGDTNFDASVDTTDFNMLGTNFGSTLPAPALGSLVPEPGSCAVLGAVGAMVMRRQRSQQRARR